MNIKEKTMLKKKIEEDENFIYCPRLSNSLEKFISTHGDGVDDERICKVLLIDQEELDQIFQSAIQKLRDGLGL